MQAYIAHCEVSATNDKGGVIDYRVLVFVDDAKDVEKLAEQCMKDDKEFFDGRTVKFLKATACSEEHVSTIDVGYIWNHGIDVGEITGTPLPTRQIPATIGFALKNVLDEFEGLATIPNEALDELVASVMTEAAVADMNATSDLAEQEQIIEQAESAAADINNLGHQAQILAVIEAMGPAEGVMQVRSAMQPPLQMAI